MLVKYIHCLREKRFYCLFSASVEKCYSYKCVAYNGYHTFLHSCLLAKCQTDNLHMCNYNHLTIRRAQ